MFKPKLFTISFRTFLILFFLFFLYEYGLRFPKVYVAAQKLDIPLNEIWQYNVLTRKLGAAVLYAFIYPFLFWGVYNRVRIIYLISRWLFVYNMFMAPFSKLFLLFTIYAIPDLAQQYSSINPVPIVLNALFLFICYFFTFLYLGYYWQRQNQKVSSLHVKTKSRQPHA